MGIVYTLEYACGYDIAFILVLPPQSLVSDSDSNICGHSTLCLNIYSS